MPISALWSWAHVREAARATTGTIRIVLLFTMFLLLASFVGVFRQVPQQLALEPQPERDVFLPDRSRRPARARHLRLGLPAELVLVAHLAKRLVALEQL